MVYTPSGELRALSQNYSVTDSLKEHGRISIRLMSIINYLT